MSFEFDNKLSAETNQTIQEAREEAEKTKAPEKDETAEMLAIQEEIARENEALESSNVFSKMSDKMKKRISVVLTGVSAFFIIMASADTAEAGRRHRGDSYSKVLKETVGDIIGNIPRDMQRHQRRSERQEDRQQRRIEKQEDRWQKQEAARNYQYEKQRQEALSKYRSAISQAKSDAELQVARAKYDLEVQAINSAERGE